MHSTPSSPLRPLIKKDFPIVPRCDSSPGAVDFGKGTIHTLVVGVPVPDSSATTLADLFSPGSKLNVLQNANGRSNTPEALMGIKVARSMEPKEVLTSLLYDKSFSLENKQLYALIQFIMPQLPSASRLSIDGFVYRNYKIESKELQYISFVRSVLLAMPDSEKQKIIGTLGASPLPFSRCNLLIPPLSVFSDSTASPSLKPRDLVFRPAPMKRSKDFDQAYRYFQPLIEITNKSDWKSGAIRNRPFGSLLVSWGKSINRESMASGLSQEYILLFPPAAPGNFHITLYSYESTDVSIRSSHATREQIVPLDTAPEQDVKFYDKLMLNAKNDTLRRLNITERPKNAILKLCAKHHSLINAVLSYTPPQPDTPYNECLQDLISLCPRHNDSLAVELYDGRQFPKKLGIHSSTPPSLAEVKMKCIEQQKYSAEELQLLFSFLAYSNLIQEQMRLIRIGESNPALEDQIRDNAVFRSVYDLTYSEHPQNKTIKWRLFLHSMFPKGKLICFKKTDSVNKSEVVYNSIEEILADPVAEAFYNEADSLVTSTLDQIAPSRDTELRKEVVFPPLRRSSGALAS